MSCSKKLSKGGTLKQSTNSPAFPDAPPYDARAKFIEQCFVNAARELSVSIKIIVDNGKKMEMRGTCDTIN
jgi:hypothetical protein